MSSSQDVRCSKFAHISKWKPVNGESTISCDIHNSSVQFHAQPSSSIRVQGKKQLKIDVTLTFWISLLFIKERSIFHLRALIAAPLPIIIIIFIWKHPLFPFLQAGRGFWSFQKLDWQNNSSRDYVTIATIVFLYFNRLKSSRQNSVIYEQTK